MAESAMKDWNIAKIGLYLLLNNETKESEALFTKHPNNLHLKACRCFVLFMVGDDRVMN